MYVSKEKFSALANGYPSGCNAVVTEYRTGSNFVGLFDIALTAYQYACKHAREDTEFTLLIGFKGFKKLSMAWQIKNPLPDSVTAVESAAEIAKEMTVNLRKYYERALLVRDYRDNMEAILDGIELDTLECCKRELDKVKGDTNVPSNLDKVNGFIVFPEEENI